MTVTEFLSKLNFQSHGSVANSWDAFSPSGAVLMQLWQAPGQRVRKHKLPHAYLRVHCFGAEYLAAKGERPVGYAGRVRAIESIELGAKGYAAISAPPGSHGPGVWAKYANLERVYPVLAVERETNGDVFVVLGEPVAADTIAE